MFKRLFRLLQNTPVFTKPYYFSWYQWARPIYLSIQPKHLAGGFLVYLAGKKGYYYLTDQQEFERGVIFRGQPIITSEFYRQPIPNIRIVEYNWGKWLKRRLEESEKESPDAAEAESNQENNKNDDEIEEEEGEDPWDGAIRPGTHRKEKASEDEEDDNNDDDDD